LLEAQHLIEVAPGRGSFVVDRSVSVARGYDTLYRTSRPTMRQVMEARIPIELETVGLAAERASDAQLGAIRQAHEKMERLTDVIPKAQADLVFHDTIAEASGNPVLRVMLASISGMTFEVMLRSNADPSLGQGVPHHPEIVEAIEARDAERARKYMYEHLSLALRAYGTDVDLEIDVMAARYIEKLLG
jgi:DNA-binding FadR family transcriptional regulator